eukprot:6956048-Pyramimonas_sp.AAC.1
MFVDFGSSEGLEKHICSSHPPRMVAQGGPRSRGGRSLASIGNSWERRLAETAELFLRGALGLPPRPKWG